jgi:hypothetical protein
MADKTQEDIHPLVGVADGHVEINGEKVVYDYDEDGKFVGWHKEEVSE